MGFIGPLLRPIRLLDDEVKEGRRPWALLSPFLDPLHERNIISPFPVLAYLRQYPLGTWELGKLGLNKGGLLWVWPFIDKGLGNRLR